MVPIEPWNRLGVARVTRRSPPLWAGPVLCTFREDLDGPSRTPGDAATGSAIHAVKRLCATASRSHQSKRQDVAQRRVGPHHEEERRAW